MARFSSSTKISGDPDVPHLERPPPGEPVDDGQSKALLLRQLTADGDVLEEVFPENLVLTARMLLKLRAIRPLIRFLLSPPAPRLSFCRLYVAAAKLVGIWSQVRPRYSRPFAFLDLRLLSLPQVPHCLKKKAVSNLAHWL